MSVGSLRVFFDDQIEVPLAYSWALHVDAAVLAASVAQTFTVPQGAAICIFNALGDFWVKRNDTATVPSASVTDGTASELSPRSKVVVAGDTISLIAVAATTVTLSYFQD